MNLQDVMGMRTDNRQPFSALTTEQQKIMMKQAGGITGGVLKKVAVPPLMIVTQTSKLAKRGIETFAKKMQKKGMTEMQIWEASFDKFGQGAYYDDLDNMWKIQVPTPDVDLNMDTSTMRNLHALENEDRGHTIDDSIFVPAGVRQWKNKPLHEIITGSPEILKEWQVANKRVGEVRSGRGVEQKGEFNPRTGEVVSAHGASKKGTLSALMHEVQHGFQEWLGMTGGSNVEFFEMEGPEFEKGLKHLKTTMSAKSWLDYKDVLGISDGDATGKDWTDFKRVFKRMSGQTPHAGSRGATRPEYNALSAIEQVIRDRLARAHDPQKAYRTTGGEGDARYTMNTYMKDAQWHRDNFIKTMYQKYAGMKFEDRYKLKDFEEYKSESPVWEMAKKKYGVGGQAPGLIGEKWNPPQSSIFDLEGLDDPARFPHVTQVAPERYKPARGVPERILPAGHKKNMDRVAGLLEEGIGKGGLSWYNLRPLKDEYINVWGEAEGLSRFNNFVKIFAATSPKAKVVSNLKRASMFQKLQEEGIDISKVLNVGKTPTPQQFNEGYTVMPKGYGDLAHTTAHMPALKDIVKSGDLTGGKLFGRPKVSTFEQNALGNLAGVTVDTHNKKAITLPLNLPKAVSDTEYGFLEDINKKQAARHGIQPAQAQSSIWTGASDITGVDDPRPLMQILNERVMETARKLNIDPAEARDLFIKGKTQLFNLLPLNKILNTFKPREPYQQMPVGTGYNTMMRGPGS